MRLIDIVTGPWAIQPEKLREIVTIYETHTRGEKIDIKAVEARLGQPLANEPATDYDVVDGVAIISVEGPIAPKGNLFMRVSGGASAQILERQVRDAADDPMVRAIMLDVDSPGGSVQGVPTVAAAVRAAAERKPLVAWTGGTMASGAYWIAAAADRIYIGEPTTVVGSIGVVATHVDVSRAETSRGIKTTEITAGRYKRIASNYEPLSDEGRATLQEQVDAIYEVFVDAVAEGRGVDVETVLADMADGRVFIGQKAVQAGLADGVLSRDALLEQLASGEYGKRRAAHQVTAGVAVPSSSTATKGVQMEPSKPITVDVIKAEHPGVAEALIAQGRNEGATAERERIRGIESVALPGFEAIVDAARFDGKSTAGDVASAIVAAQKADQVKALSAIRAEAPEPVPASPAPASQNDSAAAVAPGGFIAAGTDTRSLDAAVRKHMAAHPGTSYMDALTTITKGA